MSEKSGYEAGLGVLQARRNFRVVALSVLIAIFASDSLLHLLASDCLLQILAYVTAYYRCAGLLVADAAVIGV